MNEYELIIIGGGPAGITAGIYAKRAKINTLLIEKETVGGQVVVTDIIENYPGFDTIGGFELSERLKKHAELLNLSIKNESVLDVIKDLDGYTVKTYSNKYKCRSIILATGAKPKKLGVKGENEFYGKGVSSCATCDGFFFREKEVAVIGGGDTAVKEAIYLSKLVKKLYLVHRRDRLRAEMMLQENLLTNPKVEILWNSGLEEVIGNDSGVTGIKVKNLNSNSIKEIKLAGVFIFVGIKPVCDFLDVKKDEWGFVVTNEKKETSLSGIYAAGDCRATPLRQIATAIGDAAIASAEAGEYISRLKGNDYPRRN